MTDERETNTQYTITEGKRKVRNKESNKYKQCIFTEGVVKEIEK